MKEAVVKRKLKDIFREHPIVYLEIHQGNMRFAYKDRLHEKDVWVKYQTFTVLDCSIHFTIPTEMIHAIDIVDFEFPKTPVKHILTIAMKER